MSVKVQEILTVTVPFIVFKVFVEEILVPKIGR